MKMKSLFVVAAAGIGCSAFAYTWTGGGNDGLWTTPANWGVTSGYPQNADDPIIFNDSATVSLNTGAQTDIAYIKVTAGNVVLTATEGSSLKINWPGYNTPSGVTGDRGIVVEDGASLDLSVPLAEITGRFDRMGTGKLTIRDITVSKTDTPSWYVFNGTNEFVGTAFVNQPNADFTVGAGTPHNKSFVFIKDSARITAKKFSTSAGGNPVPNTKVTQDGAGTVVSLSSQLDLRNNSGNDGHCYTLKSGTLSASELLIAPNSNAAANYAPERLHYIQEGGTSTFSTVTLTKGSAVLRGGVMNIGNIANISTGGGCTLGLEGGMLALTSSAMTKWNWPSDTYSISPGALAAIVGSSSLSITESCTTFDLGLEIGAGKTVTISDGVKISAPAGSANAWKVAIDNGSTLKLGGDKTRIAVPLDLEVNGTGKIQMGSSGFRGAIIARRLVVDGSEQAKGRYPAKKSDGTFSTFLNAGTSDSICRASAILVPTIWTGAGGDTLWSNPANWDNNTVPNGNTAIADVSGATTITLDQNVTLNDLIVMQHGGPTKVEITGSGTSITLNSVYGGYESNVIIADNCELVLDVDLKRNAHVTYGVYGGGQLTLKKGFPGAANSANSGMWPYLAVDGTVAVAGANATINDGTYLFLSFFGYGSHQGRVLFEEGTTFHASRLWVGSAGMPLLYEFRQTGGDVTLETFYMNCGGAAGDGRPFYYLDGGSLTVQNSNGYQMINLNRPLAGNETDEAKSGTNWNGRKRYPGGSFEMSGGTLTCGGFNGCCNQNFVKLYGGDVYLYGNGMADFRWPSSIQGTNRNDYTFYLGGVTIHPKNAERSITSGNVWLTGKKGDCTLDVSERNFRFESGNTVAGPGGLIIEGSQTVISSAAFTFTGDITVKSGNITCYSASSINGPRALVVENGSSVATFGNGGTFSRVVLVQNSNLSVSSGTTLTTGRLVVGGVDVTAGTYTGVYGAGTVVVTGSAPASWEINGVGDLSWYADGTTTTVDSATTLSSLTYYPAAAGETNTLTGATLTFANGANIHVEKGDTLVIDNDVVLGGKVTKTGWGEVVFNGAVSGVETPTAASDGTDPRWLTVTEGYATFDGAVQGVRLVTCGSVDAKDPPVITLKENCTVSNYAIVLTAWNVGSAACLGETHQEGATVDYSTTVFDSMLYNRSNWALTQPRAGGFGRYVLDSGNLIGSSYFHLSFLFDASTFGEFEFVQNGGRFVVPKNFMFARRLDNVKVAYTLNDGRFEIGGYLGGVPDTSKNSLSLNGGTYVANVSDTIMRESFAFSMSGTVAFEVASDMTFTIANDAAEASSIVKTGAGTLVLDGEIALNGLDVQVGTVTLTDNILPAQGGTADLTLAKTATLCLDYDGQATFKTLTVGEHSRASGVYSATQGSNVVRRRLAGDGSLLILEGGDPGTIISIR